MTIWFASGNIHKKEELASILSCAVQKNAAGPKSPAFELKIPGEAGLYFDPDEKGNSFLENVLIKAEELYRLLAETRNQDVCHHVIADGHMIIADDSGLCVDALGGRPGIHSARYGGKDLGAAEKNALLLKELGDNPVRSARFVCAMALYYGPDRFFVAQECMEGELVKDPSLVRGSGGFGYDPILYIPELGRTVAELSPEEKNLLSHRGKAARAIASILFKLGSY